MSKLPKILTGLSLALGVSVAQGQPAAPVASSAVSLYSPPTQKHVKKPRKPKINKAASAPPNTVTQ